MYETLERGLKISPIDFTLIDHMTKYLLSRPQVGENDLGAFASEMEQRIGGKDGLEAYGRVALVAQVTEIHQKRWEGAVDSEEFDFVDPELVRKQFSVDKLRAVIPVLRERRGKEPQVMNYLCWLSCVLDDRKAARELLATLVDTPDLDIWEWRDRFDHWRHWADPSIPEPSETLPVEGEEIATFQAYSEGAVDLAFVRNNKNVLTCSSVPRSTIKNWDLAQQGFKVQFGSTDGVVIARSFQRLANSHLIVRIQRDGETETVEYEDGSDGVRAHRPTNFCGIDFNLIADNSEVAAVLTDHDITIHNQTLRRRETVPMPKLDSAAFSLNGQFLLGIGDKLHVWDGMASKELFAHDVEAKFANFSPDSSAVIYATADKLVVWDIAGNRQRFALPLDREHQVQAALMTHDGRFLASAERQAGAKKGSERHVIALYDLKHSEPVHLFEGHKHAVVRLAVARDDGRLASSSDDGVVKVWDLATATTVK
jgi:WD40 repeat protein